MIWRQTRDDDWGHRHTTGTHLTWWRWKQKWLKCYNYWPTRWHSFVITWWEMYYKCNSKHGRITCLVVRTVTQSDSCQVWNFRVKGNTLIHWYSAASANTNSVALEGFLREILLSDPPFLFHSFFFSLQPGTSLSAMAAVSITDCILPINTRPRGGQLSVILGQSRGRTSELAL